MGDCFSCLRRPPLLSPPRPLPLSPPRPPPPSTDTDTDLKSFLQNLNDISQLNDLIKFIEDLLKIASGEKTRGESSSALSSYIQDGEKFMEMVEKHVDKQKEKKEILSDISAEMEKVVMDLLKGVGKIHWVGAALSVLGFVLARYGQMSSNQSECLALLKDMFNLGKHILHLNDQMVEQKQKLNEAVQCIVVGCTMCISQFTTAKIFRFLTASVNAESLKGFQTKIDRLYSDLTLWGITDIGKKLPKIAPQSQEIYTFQNRVGIESGRERVIQLLDLNAQDASSRVVVVYGLGGIGKTTLADAVYAHIDLRKYNHCRIHMDENCNKRELKDLQEQISQGLFQENVKFTDCDQGRGMLSGFFRKRADQPLFIYIDNALKQTDIRQLLPEDLKDCLPQRSRILVTTRNLHETNIFLASIPRQEYLVSPLPDAEAKKLLLTKAFDCENTTETLQQLLQLCGGIPLVLEIIGSQLRRTSVSNMILDLLRQGEKVEEGEISSRMVDFVYNKLEQPVKEAFLDIASFFCNWESKEVAYIIGEEVFTALEEASFIKTSEEGNVIVHDIVCARGQKLSKQTRITDTQSLMDCLEDKEKLKTLKGIVISLQDDSSPIKVKEDHLNWMSKSLRHFDTRGIIFSGKSQNPFKELRYLRINGDIPYLPIVFDKLEHLAVYKGKFMQGISLYEFPASLRSMDICRQSSSWNSEAYSKMPPKVTPDSSLVKLNLVSLEKIERLPDGIHQLTKLQVLDLTGCSGLRELPSKFVELGNLKMLNLNSCSNLKELSLEFGLLTNLEDMDLGCCSALAELPLKFGQLCSLRRLNMRGCSKLKQLPSDFGQLSRLENLDLECCSSLSELPSSFSHLLSLKCLDLSGCSGLKDLPLSFGKLNRLEELKLKGLTALKELPSDFGQISNLECLYLNDCSALKKLPSNFGNLTKLEHLDLECCSSLSGLPSNFANLNSLRWLNLSRCSGLEEFPNLNFGKLSKLKELRLSGLSALKELPFNFGQRNSLTKLDLANCSSLKMLPPSFGQLIHLERLSLSNCSSLKELPSSFGQLKNLKKLDLSNCSNLKEWPSNFGDLTNMKKLVLSGICPNLRQSLPSLNCEVL